MVRWACVVAWGVTTGVGLAQSVVLYDSLHVVNQQLYDRAFVSCIGTPPSFTSLRDAQCADDFSTDKEYRITSVTGDYTSKLGTMPSEGVWVQFYRDLGGTPEEAVYAEALVPPSGVTLIDLGTIPGLGQYNFGRRFEVDLTGVQIVLPAGRWWLSMQPVDVTPNGDWYWMLRDTSMVIGLDMHGRDGEHPPPYAGIPPLLNRPDWTPLGVIGLGGPGTISIRVEGGAACYADCDGSGGLDLFDFLCFVNAFNVGDPYADCDGSGVLDLFDFLCFVNEFNAGCA